MIGYKHAVLILLVLGVTNSCVDNRANRSDEETMLIYRDCMDHAPQQWNAHDASSVLSNKKNKGTVSFDVNVRTERQIQNQMNCLQQAGWDQD